MREKSSSEPIMPTLKRLKKGETISFSLDRVLSVRAVCSSLSLQSNLKFKTNTNRENRIITVERL